MSLCRWIAHLDMDAFYASVELLRYPDLRGQPVVVGGRRSQAPEVLVDGSRRYARLRDYAGRGVVTTATYEARAQGVHSGMGLMKSAALAPNAILLPADFDAYRRASRQFKAAVAGIAPDIEDRGIDEIYIDLSHVPGAQDSTPDDPHAGVRALARRIQQSVLAETGLNCSLGITPNKLLSKLCSDLEKPKGLTLLRLDQIAARIWPLPARRLNGIGPKAAEKLDALGIHTLGELATTPVSRLVAHFGQHFGLWLHEAAHGRDERPLETHREPKSFSRETTFERDLHARDDRAELGDHFTRLCRQVADDLARRRYQARTIGIKLRFGDFQTLTRDLTLPRATADAAEIRAVAGQCLKRMPLEKRLRLLGVRASSLEPAAADKETCGLGENLSLFD